MNKKLLIVAILIISFIFGGVIIWRFKKGSSMINPMADPSVESSSTVKLADWEDAAGFSFSYPEDINIDPHEEDEKNYAHLELTLPAHEGKIIILVKETEHADIEAWLEETGVEAQILDTELGAKPAKKMAYTDPQKIVTVAIDVDALVLIEMIPDKEGYWNKVYDQVLKSFTFIPLEGEEKAISVPDQGGANIIEEVEEIIE